MYRSRSNSINSNYKEEFRKAVIISFDRLISQHNFRIIVQEEGAIVFKSSKCFVRVSLDRRSVLVDVAPVRGRKQASYITLSMIICCLKPDANFEDRVGLKPADIRAECDRLFDLLIKYCEPMIYGDFSLWPQIIECANNIINESYLNQENIQDKLNVEHIKQLAESARRARDWKSVANLYSSIIERLTTVEIKRLEYAKKKIGKHP